MMAQAIMLSHNPRVNGNLGSGAAGGVTRIPVQLSRQYAAPDSTHERK